MITKTTYVCELSESTQASIYFDVLNALEKQNVYDAEFYAQEALSCRICDLGDTIHVYYDRVRDCILTYSDMAIRYYNARRTGETEALTLKAYINDIDMWECGDIERW